MKEMIYKDISTPEMLDEGHYKQYHYAILSLGSHPCAYVEIPENHKYFGVHYDHISLNCHGGLTYSALGLLPKAHPEHKKGYWIGWDYAHYTDYTFYSSITFQGRTWSTEEILSEVKQVIDQLCEMDRGDAENEHDTPELLNNTDNLVSDGISQPVLQPATPENFELMQG